MAFVTRRWIMMLALGCAGLVAAYLPPPEGRVPRAWNTWEDYPTPEGRRAKRLHDDFRSALERYQILHIRDSVLIAASHLSSGHDSRVILLSSRALTAARQALANSVSHAADAIVPPGRSDARVVLAFVVDTSGGWYAGSRYYTPSVTDGRTCLTIVSVGQEARQSLLPERMAPEEVLGPCTFYLAFGQPGPAIAHWLAARRFDVASRPSWSARSQSAPLEETFNPSTTARLVAEWLSGTAYMDPSSLSALYWQSPLGLRCALGEADFCRSFLLSDSTPDPNATPDIAGVVNRRYYEVEEQHWLADLLNQMGPAPFRRFWRSRLAPDSAFHDAFGVSFDQWAPQWAHAHIGLVQPSLIIRGREWLWSVFWILVFMAAGWVVVSRRQVA